MVEVTNELLLRVDRGPNWLFVKLSPSHEQASHSTHIAEDVWSVVSRHFTYRVVLELDELHALPGGMVGQLKSLQERLAEHDGAKICSLATEHHGTWRDCQMDESLRIHETREQAVLGR